MKRRSWLAVVFGFLMLGCVTASAQLAVLIGPRPVLVPRPPVAAVVRPVAVCPAPVIYGPVYEPVVVPRRYYMVARPVVVYRSPVLYPQAVRRAYWRHERWDYRHGRL